jgi:hypothetical protein
MHGQAPSSVQKAIAAGTVCVTLCGCAAALTPGVPAGPISAPGLRIGSGYSYAQAPGTAHGVDRDAGPVTVHGNSAMLWGRAISIFPAGLLFRVAPRQWFDVGVDLGIRESALQLRAGQLAASRALPWGVELEWRTGSYIYERDELFTRRNVVRLRAEAYPELPLGRSDSGSAGFGVLALGLSTGTQLLTINQVPNRYVEPESSDIVRDPSFDELHWETRLEGALGLHLGTQRGGYTLVFLPWLKLHQGAPIATECVSCTLYLDLSGVESSWGFGVALNGMWQVE